MPLITRITRLKHPGVLRDFQWPSELPDFGKYNLIYSWNGSGKTTISNVLRALELKRPLECEATVVIKGTQVSGSDFASNGLPVRVFNRDFVSESVFPVGGGDVPPIFVFGKESAEKQSEVERLKKKKAKANGNRELNQGEKGKADKALDKHCIDQATLIRESLRSAGNNPYNNYDKARYRQHAQGMATAGDKDDRLVSDNERETLLTQSRATPKKPIQEISYRVPDLRQAQAWVSQLLQTTVVSSAIAELRNDPSLSSWIRQGLGLHQERESQSCLFCEQPLPGNRVSSLEAHFSAEYERLLQNLDEEAKRVEGMLRAAQEVALPSRAEFYEDLAEEYETAAKEFTDNRKIGSQFLEGLAKALKEKREKPFEVMPLTVAAPSTVPAVDALNEVIRKHNDASTEFDQRVSAARERLEAHLVASSLDEYTALRKAVNDAESALNEANREFSTLGDQIAELEADIIEHLQPAEELNSELHSYLGHDELRLDVKNTGYEITRNGTPAKGLSEGERTGIALLYFLKSLQDRGFESGKGVVVLDDPVSSLDANALFLAFGHIKRCADGAGQLFILTHNFGLFRQVRNWFHYLKGQGKKDIAQRPARFYMLECRMKGAGRQAVLKPLDPLLEQFNSEYHFLFSQIYRRAQAAGNNGLEANYIFPNMARRLLETFLAFRQPDYAGELRQKLEAISFDENKKTRILRFLHTYSHADAVVDSEHDPSGLGEAPAVLNDLLALVQQEDPSHYDAMVKLVDPPQGEGSS